MKGVFSSCALLSVSVRASNQACAAPDIAVEAQYGSPGLGAQIIAPIAPDRLRFRVGVNGANLHRNYSDQNIGYGMKMKLGSASALLDFHPFAGAFRVSGGIFYDNNSFNLTANPASDVNIDDDTCTPDQVGALSGKMTFRKTAPYLGIGWGNAVGKDKRLSFSSDIDVLFQGTPRVTLSSSNQDSGPTLDSEVQAQQQKMQDGARSFKYWPAISFGLAYKF